MFAEQPAGHVTTPIMPARPLCFGRRKWMNVFAKGMPCGDCDRQWPCRLDGEDLRAWCTQADRNASLIRIYARENHDLRERVEALVRDAVAARRDWEACMGHYDTLMSDYAAVKAARNELARFVNGWDTSYSWDTDAHTFRCRGCQTVKHVGVACDHAPGCPVALAERIVKEAGDGR